MASDGQQQRAAAAAEGFYCSTSGTYFSDKESLAEHYKSDFHRYNLKRKVAGLPPVTKEWFEARKAQLTSAAAAPHQKVWYDPLTKKKFQTQQTYQAHVNSKKYQQLVRDSGQPAPSPIVMVKQLQQPQEAQEQQAQQQAAAAAPATAAGEAKPAAAAAAAAAAGFTVKAPARSSAAAAAAAERASDLGREPQEEEEEDDNEADEDGGASSGWETASGSEDGGGGEEEWEEWDVRASLFDNRLSASMQDNLQYMYRTFGFYLPDAEYLSDPEGLLKYLGAKLRYGKVPLYTAGDDPNARQFRSLHAVQRHMVDRNQCKMLYDDNEDEYADFYDYSAQHQDGEEEQDDGEDGAAASAAAGAQQLAVALDGLALSGGGGGGAAGGWELSVPGGGSGSGGGGGKVLGSRELARYYRQRPRPQDTRHSVAVNTIIAQYRSLGVATKASKPAPAERAAQRAAADNQKRQQQRLWMRNNVNFNLPKNVTY